MSNESSNPREGPEPDCRDSPAFMVLQSHISNATEHRTFPGSVVRMDLLAYALFVVLNVVLFLRLQELFPELFPATLYLWCVVACLVATPWPLLRQLSVRNLQAFPVTFCVLG